MSSVFNHSEFTIEDNVLKGKEVFYDDEYTSLGEFVLRRLEEDPDFVGQVDAVTGEEYTYGKMRERSVRCALWMQSQGLRQGDVVALCSDNHLDFAMPCFAALYLGAVFSPLDAEMNSEGLRHEMNITKPKMAFVSESTAAVVAAAAREAGLDLAIIVFGRVPGFLEFDAIIVESGIDEVEKFSCTPIQTSDEIASIIFSSGTTGPSKGVALSHRGLTLSMRQSTEFGMLGNVCLTFSASDWLTSVIDMFMTLSLKIPRIILPLFEKYSACALMEKYKASWVFLSPSMINELVKSDATGRYDLSSVTSVLHSGTQLSIVSYRALKKLLPQAQIISSYGMTECCGESAVQSAKSQPGSCGQVMQNAQIKVIDPDTGRTLGPNQKGELMLKFAGIMSCYYNDPEATAQAIDEEGWRHSGDLGYFDETGEIFVVDRMKDIVRLGDSDDISPTEIESVILSHPGVQDVAVVGQPIPEDDDRLIAFVVRAEEYSDTGSKQVTEAEIVNLVAAELPKSRYLRGGVRFIDQIPRTPSDKIRRIPLRNLARSMLRCESNN